MPRAAAREQWWVPHRHGRAAADPHRCARGASQPCDPSYAAALESPEARAASLTFSRGSMTMRMIVLMVALLSAAAAVHAQEPVVGVKDPESLFKDSDPALNRNKQA